MDPAKRKLTTRAETMARWDSIPAASGPFQRRLDGGLCGIRRTY